MDKASLVLTLITTENFEFKEGFLLLKYKPCEKTKLPALQLQFSERQIPLSVSAP